MIPDLGFVVPFLGLGVVGGGGWYIASYHPHWMEWGKHPDRKKKPVRTLNPSGALDARGLGKHFIVLARGDDEGAPRIQLSEESRYLHMHLLGPTGTGKSWYGIYSQVFQDIHHGAGQGYWDVKGNMDQRLYSYAVHAGRQHDFLRFQVLDPEHSLKYSPFVGPPHEVADRVWTAFFQDDNTSTPYYKEAAQTFCRNFFGQCAHLVVLPTFIQLQACLMDQEDVAKLVAMAPHTRQAKWFRKRVLGMDSQTFIETYGGFVNKLDPLVEGPFASLLNTCSPDIIMEDVVSKSRLLYVGLAADMYPATYKIVSTMMLMDLQSNLTKRYGKKNVNGMFVYLDEFASLVYPEFKNLLNKARDAKVGFILAHQTLGDLKAISEAFYDSVMGGLRNKVLLAAGTADTAEVMARLIGTKTVETPLVNYAYENGLLGQALKAKGVTIVSGEEFIAHPNELKNLPVGEAFLILARKENGRETYKVKLIPAPRGTPGTDVREAPPPRGRQVFKPLLLGGRPEPEAPKGLGRIQGILKNISKNKKKP